MTQKPPTADEILRRINDLSAEAAHRDDEARSALMEAGLQPEAFVEAVRQTATPLLMIDRFARPAPRLSVFDVRMRTWSLGAIAASAIVFVTAFTINHRFEVEAQNRLAESTAQLVRFETTSRTLQVRTGRNQAFTVKIQAGLQKLELSRDPDDRKVAIWNDLLPVLLEARKNRDEFMDVAIEYQRVLPLLRVRNPEVFLDSYWGELWILNILLQSRIAPVVELARQQAPDPADVDRVFRQNAGSLAGPDRKAFEEAVSAYRTTLAAVR